ncbi:hypothetical protein [Haladaptatus pallidirubidus]|uniref:Uncharacterized protein n=1 Tax=Haladaptatus pallidirubidus TaxID=1008152 RepID=A0AAV3UC46_9EURY|nr:hypothetical protein [Haladaptatus pallidirubidus]
MALVFLFWNAFLSIPSIGSGEGDSPAFLFMFIFAPFYIVGYGLLAGGEYWFGGCNVSLPHFEPITELEGCSMECSLLLRRTSFCHGEGPTA